ncbi:MAG: DUF1674 domain-containing protein [Methylococcales bacterium]
MDIESRQESSKKAINPKETVQKNDQTKKPVEEIGGVEGPEPTRYGDWEKNGRCVDF